MLKSKAPMTSILNPDRKYVHSWNTNITKSPAWQAAIAARELRQAMETAKRGNVRRMK